MTVDSRWLLFPLAVFRANLLVLATLVALTVAVFAFAGMGRALSDAAPSSPLDSGDCAYPCWQGFQPGVTGYAEALGRIQGVKLASADSLVLIRSGGATWRQSVEWLTRTSPVYEVHMRFTRDLLDRIDLYPRDPVRLETIFGAFGAPSHAFCQLGLRYFSVQLYFYGGSVEVWAMIDPVDHAGPWQIGGDLQVTRVSFQADLRDTLNIGPIPAYPWEGFVRANVQGLCH
jgi:hypothetical protein